MAFRRAFLLMCFVVAGSVLYAVPVVSPSFGLLAFVSTAPWLVLATSDRWSLRTSALAFLVSAYGAALLFLPWLRSFNVVGWLVAPLFYVPLFLPIFVLTRALRTAWPRLPLSVIWPVAFTAGEYLRIRLSAGEISFGQLGASLVSCDALIQSADIAGMWVLTFLAAAVAAHVVDLFTLARKAPHALRRRHALTTTGMLALLFAAMSAYGVYQLRRANFVPGPRIRVVQPNFANWDVATSMARVRFTSLLTLTRMNAARGGVDLIVWPENAVMPYEPYDALGRASDADQQLRALAAATGATVLIDGPTGNEPRKHHTAAAIFPDGRIVSYHKRLLVPWSECVPYEGLLRGISERLADGFIAYVRSHNSHLQSFAPGETSTIFRIHSVGAPTAFAAPICYETLSASYIRSWAAKARRDGIRRFFVVNPVNEKLLGYSVHATTLAVCRFRAIESRITVVRAANNGISAAIDPNGHVYGLVRGRDGYIVDRAGTMETTVLFDPRFGTIYSRFGDWLPILCLLVGAAAIVSWSRTRLARNGRLRAVSSFTSSPLTRPSGTLDT